MQEGQQREGYTLKPGNSKALEQEQSRTLVQAPPCAVNTIEEEDVTMSVKPSYTKSNI